MSIPINEAEFEDTDEVTPDLLEDIVVQTTSDDIDGWLPTDIHLDQPTANGVP